MRITHGYNERKNNKTGRREAGSRRTDGCKHRTKSETEKILVDSAFYLLSAPVR